MLDLSTLALFSGACLALTATPGPDMLLIASRSVSQGRRAGFATLAGIQAGTYCHALAAALGLSQLFVAVPIAYDAVRFAGAAYLLYLAWKTFRSDATALSPVASQRRRSIGQRGVERYVGNPQPVDHRGHRRGAIPVRFDSYGGWDNESYRARRLQVPRGNGLDHREHAPMLAMPYVDERPNRFVVEDNGADLAHAAVAASPAA